MPVNLGKHQKTQVTDSLLRVFSFITAIVLIISLSACSGNEISFESSEEIKGKLTNYMISVEFKDSEGIITDMTELRCDEGYIWKMDDSILYLDYGTGKMYQLYAGNKTGITMIPDNPDSYRDFGVVISSYILFHDTYKDFGVKKAGKEKIANRETTAYTFSYDGQKYKFWVDDELGITMKYEITTDEEALVMDVTELKVGGQTLSAMVNLSEYDIADMNVPIF